MLKHCLTEPSLYPRIEYVSINRHATYHQPLVGQANASLEGNCEMKYKKRTKNKPPLPIDTRGCLVLVYSDGLAAIILPITSPSPDHYTSMYLFFLPAPCSKSGQLRFDPRSVLLRYRSNQTLRAYAVLGWGDAFFVLCFFFMNALWYRRPTAAML